MLPGLTFAIWVSKTSAIQDSCTTVFQKLQSHTNLPQRSFEIITLIPTLGMLSWFVHIYTKANSLTPTYILVLFIVSVLACFWAVATLLAYGATKYNAQFCAAIDLMFVGAFIAGVYYLRGISNQDCAHWNPGKASGGINVGFASVGGTIVNPFGVTFDKSCAMLKASFAFGIMNCIFFFVTFVSCFLVQKRDNVANSKRSWFCCGLLDTIMIIIAPRELPSELSLGATILEVRDDRIIARDDTAGRTYERLCKKVCE